MDDSTKNEIIKSTTEIVKTAYEDAFQPVAKETGKALGTLGKSVNVALSPLRGVVWGYEQIEAFIHEKVSKKLEDKGTRKEDVVTPDPDIAVPTVEALRYSKLKDEFATLLANAMDSKTSKMAHPSFVDILKQMSLLDAKIVKNLEVVGYTPVLEISTKMNDRGSSFRVEGYFYGGTLALIQRHNEDNFLISIDNLLRMGIAEVSYTYSIDSDASYKVLRQSDNVRELKKSIGETKYLERKGVLKVTEFGKSFKKTCT